MNEHRLDRTLSGLAATRVCECERACVHVEVGEIRLKFTTDQFLLFAESLMDDYCRLLVRREMSNAFSPLLSDSPESSPVNASQPVM